MRDVPASLEKAWRDGEFIGERTAIARVTVQHPTMVMHNYSLTPVPAKASATALPTTESGKTTLQAAQAAYTKALADLAAAKKAVAAGKTLKNGKKVTAKDAQAALATYKKALEAAQKKKTKVSQSYADFLFTTMGKPLELPNIKSLEWSRSIDSDVADCTITIWNTRPLPIGETPVATELDQPGYYTYSRGGSNFSARWGQERNAFFGMLVPDNIIRTYEGYGYDDSVPPELDENLVQTGVWLIDTVAMSTDGTLTIKCRDIGRLLLDQYCYQPVSPDDFYDHGFTPWDEPVKAIPGTSGKLVVKAQDSSNTPWIGSGSVQGHKLAWAFDGNPNTYWLSIGNDAASRRYAYEWVQCSVNNQTVSEVRVRTKKKNYTCYVSVKVGGVWQGTHEINYHEDGIGQNGGDIKYVKHVQIDTEQFVSVKFAPIAKVQAVRVTVGNLQNFGFGPYRYRGGVRDVEVYGVAKAGTKGVTVHTGPAGANPGKYKDYTDIVKILCAWGGFFWPKGAHWKIANPPGTDPLLPIVGFDDTQSIVPGSYDSAVLGKGVKGRVWGDFMNAGVAGVVELEWSNFDKKSLMEGISYIRDILGFVFFIDEFGGVQWRLPNVFNFGCVRSTLSAKPGYVKSPHTIDERSILLSLDATIDSRNVRESNFVGQNEGKIGAFAPGFNPNPTGIRRIGAWTDQNFETVKECQRMADMISLAQLFTYRTDRIQIPANPKIQIDDQVRIIERSTAEGYVHYVKSISSNLDVETGEWTYDLETHWLGEDPKTKWIFSPQQLYHVTKETIEAQLKIQVSDIGPDRRPS